MKSTYDKTQFTIYRYTSEKTMLVAVENEYIPKIKHAKKEFGNLKDVPPDWEVRGIFIETAGTKGIKFDPDTYQSEIIINCLEEYTPAA